MRYSTFIWLMLRLGTSMGVIPSIRATRFCTLRPGRPVALKPPTAPPIMTRNTRFSHSSRRSRLFNSSLIYTDTL